MATPAPDVKAVRRTLGAVGAERERSAIQTSIRRFLRHRLAVAGLIIVLILVFAAVFANQVSPHDPNAIVVTQIDDRPSAIYPLGLDQVGRDNLSRLIHAARISLSVGLVAVSIYIVIGTVLGALAGYFGGAVDILITRLTDTFLSFPTLMLILVVVSLVGPRIWNVMLVLGLLGWPPTCRLVRGEFLSLRERDYVHAARASGAVDSRIIFRHVLPNAMGPILVNATFGVATAILTEAALSFLGLGVQPPTASWGNMLTSAQSLSILEQRPFLWVPPGFAIFISVLAINFVGDGLRDALDPRLKR